MKTRSEVRDEVTSGIIYEFQKPENVKIISSNGTEKHEVLSSREKEAILYGHSLQHTCPRKSRL